MLPTSLSLYKERFLSSSTTKTRASNLLNSSALLLVSDTFDVIISVAALDASYIPVGVVRELCCATKPGNWLTAVSRARCDTSCHQYCKMVWKSCSVVTLLPVPTDQPDSVCSTGGLVCMARGEHACTSQTICYKKNFESECQLMEAEGLWKLLGIKLLDGCMTDLQLNPVTNNVEECNINGTLYLYQKATN